MEENNMMSCMVGDGEMASLQLKTQEARVLATKIMDRVVIGDKTHYMTQTFKDYQLVQKIELKSRK